MRYNVSSMRMMLSISMILLFQLSFLNFANAQKYACVNTDYVLSKLPDYVNAQQRLDRYVADWQQEHALVGPCHFLGVARELEETASGRASTKGVRGSHPTAATFWRRW